MTADEAWIEAHVAEFAAYVVEEKLSTDEVWEWMEYHYQRPFPKETVQAMLLAMTDLVVDS